MCLIFLLKSVIFSRCSLQACRLLLTVPAVSEETSGQSGEAKRGYDQLIGALVSLMSVGTDYSNENRKQAERVLLATSSHQCFSLSMSMLGTLPPSYHVLATMVEGEGLSVMVRK